VTDRRAQACTLGCGAGGAANPTPAGTPHLNWLL